MNVLASINGTFKPLKSNGQTVNKGDTIGQVYNALWRNQIAPCQGTISNMLANNSRVNQNDPLCQINSTNALDALT
jgi:biotin carboxyl carrier protein